MYVTVKLTSRRISALRTEQHDNTDSCTHQPVPFLRFVVLCFLREQTVNNVAIVCPEFGVVSVFYLFSVRASDSRDARDSVHAVNVANTGNGPCRHVSRWQIRSARRQLQETAAAENQVRVTGSARSCAHETL